MIIKGTLLTQLESVGRVGGSCEVVLSHGLV